eukprot:3936040-Rhodomonas_salina.3
MRGLKLKKKGTQAAVLKTTRTGLAGWVDKNPNIARVLLLGGALGMLAFAGDAGKKHEDEKCLGLANVEGIYSAVYYILSFYGFGVFFARIFLYLLGSNGTPRGTTALIMRWVFRVSVAFLSLVSVSYLVGLFVALTQMSDCKMTASYNTKQIAFALGLSVVGIVMAFFMNLLEINFTKECLSPVQDDGNVEVSRLRLLLSSSRVKALRTDPEKADKAAEAKPVVGDSEYKKEMLTLFGNDEAKLNEFAKMGYWWYYIFNHRGSVMQSFMFFLVGYLVIMAYAFDDQQKNHFLCSHDFAADVYVYNDTSTVKEEKNLHLEIVDTVDGALTDKSKSNVRNYILTFKIVNSENGKETSASKSYLLPKLSGDASAIFNLMLFFDLVVVCLGYSFVWVFPEFKANFQPFQKLDGELG